MNMMFDGFTDTLKKDGRIEIRGLGVLPSGIMIHTPEGIPETGKRIRVGDKRLLFFKVGK